MVAAARRRRLRAGLAGRVLAAEALSGFAHAATAPGDPDRAARLAGAATTLGITTGTVAAPDRVRRPARAATTLGVTTGFDPTLSLGQSMGRRRSQRCAVPGPARHTAVLGEVQKAGMDAGLPPDPGIRDVRQGVSRVTVLMSA
jgi:hypothetical protein